MAINRHGPYPIRSTSKVDLVKLSPQTIFERLLHALTYDNFGAYIDIKHLLLVNPKGSKISFDAIPYHMMMTLGTLLCVSGSIDLLRHFDKYLPQDRPYRYKMLYLAATHPDDYNIVCYLLSQNIYPSKARGFRKENIDEDKEYLKELTEYGEIIAATACDKEMETNRRVKICLELINADPRCIIDSRENMYLIRKCATYNDLLPIIERIFQIEADSTLIPDPQELKNFFEYVAETKAKKVFQFLIEKVIPNIKLPDFDILMYLAPSLDFLIRNDQIEMFPEMFHCVLHSVEDWYHYFFNDVFGTTNSRNAPRIMNYLLRLRRTEKWGEKIPCIETLLTKTIRRIVPPEEKDIGLEQMNIRKLTVMLVYNRSLININSHYMANYFDPTINFYRCYSLTSRGADLSLIEGLNVTTFDNNKKEFQETIKKHLIIQGLCGILDSYVFDYDSYFDL
ncbi:MAG: hypothetical protein Hyperionvirus10_21 [Hyperionvirus sp.]|uniref:Uncharacterized protein n=1 Tax=Hyperionvirus sp. TaxID=2487770 RepID=A0A3G5A8X4_9VIRU|nr:MAG: hypothetical protein Hyperionvirus10_21 [Hyperionvirus sp.]